MSRWIPPAEISRPQPYSMGPLLRWAPLHVVPQLPAVTSIRADGDRPAVDIMTCLVAPRAVQRAARAAGVAAVARIWPNGIEKVNPRLEGTHARMARLLREAAERDQESE